MPEAATVTPFRTEGARLQTHVREDGDLIIEGDAAVFAGVDRSAQRENFVPGAFRHGIATFLGGSRPLCFHHRKDHVIGEVLELRETERGLRLKARVDYQPDSSPLAWVYHAIRKGSIRGLSVGGFFRRAATAVGQRIVGVDFTEISATPVPAHAAAGFRIVEGKALSGADAAAYLAGLEFDARLDLIAERQAVRHDAARVRSDAALLRARTALDRVALLS
ncbi:MAG: hypothetical protein GXY03_00220 [Solirubrobacterales bacterium]|nr:hypothetical protein [Solirubrobacterales bacterium]